MSGGIRVKTKKILFVALMFLLISALPLSVSYAGTVWNIETVDSTGDVGWYLSLAFDSGGNPCISYLDYTNGDLKYAKWTGSSWNIQTVDSTGDVGKYSSLAFDSGGNPCISYYGVTNGDLKYARGQDVPPTCSIVINAGAAFTSSTSVTLSLTYTAYGATVSEVRYSNDGVWDTEGWEAPSITKSWTLTSGDGTKTVYYQVKDSGGILSSTAHDSILLDATNPTGSILINNGDAYTSSMSVTLSLTYSDTGSGVDEVRYTNDGVWDTEGWEAPSTTKSWTLTSGDGEKAVYYQVKDNAGLLSSTYSGTITLETLVYYDLTISVDGAGSTSPGVGTHSYEEGTDVDVAATASAGWSFSHWLLDFVDVGSANPYTVTMNADHSLTAVFTEVTGAPPVAQFTYSPPNPLVNETISFDASGCSDADGVIVGYLWDFGDGDTSTSQNPTHAYDQAGSYTVTLTVTDDDGLTDTATQTINDVIPEFQTWIVLPIFVIFALAVMIYRKKLTKKNRS